MNPIKKSDLENLAEWCNKEIPEPGYKYVIEYAYGQPVLFLGDARGCGHNVSPRCSKRELSVWIWAYLSGARAHRYRVARQVAAIEGGAL